MRIIKYTLLPFAFLYGIIISIRNLFFDWGVLKSKRFQLPIIAVGNLSTGGTGKSPMIEYLVRLLGNNPDISILSRGYRRKTRGYLPVLLENDYSDYGDEPFQFKKKFPSVNAVVSENRVEGVERILQDFPQTQVVLLDDAFQHRWIKPGLSILLIPYDEVHSIPFLLPAGNQREYLSGAQRAEIIVISKCPANLQEEERMLIVKKIRKNPAQQIYFSGFSYGKPVSILPQSPEIHLEKYQGKILLLTGIANPKPLKEYLSTFGLEIYHTAFPDHHDFFDKDLDDIQKIFNNIAGSEKIIITTEKDSMRLQKFANENLLENSMLKTIYYVPIEVNFLSADGEKFNQQIVTYVRKN